MKNNFLINALIVIALLVVSCTKDDSTNKEMPTETPNTNEKTPAKIPDTNDKALTKLPNDVTQLFVGKGNANASTVLIYEQGGPDKELDSNYFEMEGSFPTNFTPLFKNYYRVYAHQALTYNTKLCAKDKISKTKQL